MEMYAGLHSFKALPRPGEGVAAISGGKGYDSVYRPGVGCLVLVAAIPPLRADTLTRNTNRQ